MSGARCTVTTDRTRYCSTDRPGAHRNRPRAEPADDPEPDLSVVWGAKELDLTPDVIERLNKATQGTDKP